MEMTVAGLNVERRGSGPPMLLMHGIGHRWQMWLPVIDHLAEDFDVVAVDLPGFGRSPRAYRNRSISFDGGTEWVGDMLTELGWDRAHLVGNSLGGWVALELARRDRALSVTGLAPAGLWVDRRRMERRLRRWFRLWVGGARHLGPMVGLLRFAVVRTLALQGLFGRPWRIPGDVAIADAHNLAGSAFDEVFEGESAERFTGGRTIPVPVTVAWCTRDPLFDPKTCAVDELPASTVLEVLPGCGHVPTWDDPDRVLGVIRATTARATGPRPRAGAGVGAGSDLPVPAGDPSPPPTTAPA